MPCLTLASKWTSRAAKSVTARHSPSKGAKAIGVMPCYALASNLKSRAAKSCTTSKWPLFLGCQSHKSHAMLCFGVQNDIASSQIRHHVQGAIISCQSHWSHAMLFLGVQLEIASSQVSHNFQVAIVSCQVIGVIGVPTIQVACKMASERAWCSNSMPEASRECQQYKLHARWHQKEPKCSNSMQEAAKECPHLASSEVLHHLQLASVSCQVIGAMPC